MTDKSVVIEQITEYLMVVMEGNVLESCSILTTCLCDVISSVENDTQRKDIAAFHSEFLPQKVEICRQVRDEKMTMEEGIEALKLIGESVEQKILGKQV